MEDDMPLVISRVELPKLDLNSMEARLGNCPECENSWRGALIEPVHWRKYYKLPYISSVLLFTNQYIEPFESLRCPYCYAEWRLDTMKQIRLRGGDWIGWSN